MPRSRVRIPAVAPTFGFGLLGDADFCCDVRCVLLFAACSARSKAVSTRSAAHSLPRCIALAPIKLPETRSACSDANFPHRCLDLLPFVFPRSQKVGKMGEAEAKALRDLQERLARKKKKARVSAHSTLCFLASRLLLHALGLSVCLCRAPLRSHCEACLLGAVLLFVL